MPVPQPQAHTQPQVCVFLLQPDGPKDLLTKVVEDVLPLPDFLRRPLTGLIAKGRVTEGDPRDQEVGDESPLLRNTKAQRDALTIGWPIWALSPTCW